MPWQPQIFKTSHSTAQKHVPRGGPSGQQGLTIDAIAVAFAFSKGRTAAVPHRVSVTAWPGKIHFWISFLPELTEPVCQTRNAFRKDLAKSRFKHSTHLFCDSTRRPYLTGLRSCSIIGRRPIQPPSSMSNNMTNNIVQPGQVDCRSVYPLTQP
ncbi:hypothetical protein BJX68DRAFT_243921 [Aspergillus pseudodeflectus]|uniref:Uncharacterized protein n=1 Tax=Aspergillus pseudodeflectus TaxID=176178 RepID=A0ABR4JTP1_9EURO